MDVFASQVTGKKQQATEVTAAAVAVSGSKPGCAVKEDIALTSLPIQRKLSIGAVNDPLEQEADAMAGTVMRMPEASFVQRKCAHCEEEEKVQRKPLASSITPFIQAKGGNGGTASDSVTNKINTTRGSGSPMDRPTQSFMESRFGTDFSNVKIHTGNDAVQMNRELNAQAFTVGSDIYFNSGKYNPSSESGRHLLAHELTHTIQQGGTAARTIQKADEEGGAPAPVNGGLSDEMLVQIARQLYRAMDGPGTDEEAIYSAFAGRTIEQGEAIARVYQQQYHRNLSADLQDELTRDEMLHLAIFAPPGPGTATPEAQSSSMADMVARQLNAAMNRPGTDESSIMAALTGRTQAELTAIKDACLRLTTRTLEHDLRDELSGSDLTQALRLLNQGLLQPEDELYLAMEGLGTDEDTIFRVLDALATNNAGIAAMESSYRTKYGDLVADLRGDLTSGEYRRAMRVLRPALQDAAFEDCTPAIIQEARSYIPVGMQKLDHAIEVLSRGIASMTAPELAQFNRFFDPLNTGNIDQRFADQVLANYRAIRQQFEQDLTIECEDAGGLCSGNLYYTYWSNIHLCKDAFTTNTDPVQKARDMVHELAHNAMYAVDRAYYDDTTASFAKDLTPRGSPAAQIPVIGPLIGLMLRSDTLYNPDSYSWFAFEVP
jgi:Domain of unknown function (DUF4157)/Annexin/Lysine-specific metallo-endopeptidase